MRRVLCLALILSGCGNKEPSGCTEEMLQEETCDVDRHSDAIVNGNWSDAIAMGVAQLTGKDGLLDKTCTLAMIDNRHGFTSHLCASLTSARASLGGVTVSVRTVRYPVGSPLPVVELASALPLSASYRRDISRTAVAKGDVLTCYGYTDGELSNGAFTVESVDADVVTIKGRSNYPFEPFDLGRGDEGAMCLGSTMGIVAIVNSVDLMSAKLLKNVSPSAIDDLRMAFNLSLSQVAISFINRSTGKALRGAASVDAYATTEPRTGSISPQGFYQMSVPSPWPGTSIVMLVNAANGLCLNAVSLGPVGLLSARRCDSSRNEQKWYVEFDGADYRLRPLSNTNFTADSAAMLTTWNNLRSQEWGVWLNWF